MTGVEILSSEEVAVAWAKWNWGNFWITIGAVFIISLIVGLIFAQQDNDMLAFWIMFGVLFVVGGGISSVLVGINTGEPTIYETQYKVIIDDTVSFTDFIDKYEILDQEGKIYTVKEKTND